ncbi:hypothetical protein [Acidobacterium sp. S8]|uniref:hypothetical protein n=1 Tax=Acidobacterium sp. S8 TaxID=1641854 RepID=UPI00131AF568|nr:hypothetical protein [Acidobacterium sp. S8]
MNRTILIGLLLSSSVAIAQSGKNTATPAELDAPTTLPIVFTKTIAADQTHAGDMVTAKTSQVVHLSNGALIPSGAKITGHVVAANGFAYDKTPYAHQRASTLTLKFDSVQVGESVLPLNAMVRAMADPITSEQAHMKLATDIDSQGTTTQIGGDQVTPRASEVVNSDGDVVGYNKHGGVYAHLIASGACDSSDVEVSMGIYSASACGLYGFNRVSAAEMGSQTQPSILTLVSTHVSPKVWKDSTALLEILPSQQNAALR